MSSGRRRTPSDALGQCGDGKNPRNAPIDPSQSVADFRISDGAGLMSASSRPGRYPSDRSHSAAACSALSQIGPLLRGKGFAALPAEGLVSPGGASTRTWRP